MPMFCLSSITSFLGRITVFFLFLFFGRDCAVVVQVVFGLGWNVPLALRVERRESDAVYNREAANEKWRVLLEWQNYESALHFAQVVLEWEIYFVTHYM